MMSYRIIAGYNDYEIAEEYPHQVRRISTDHVVSEFIANNGYYVLHLVSDDGRRKTVYKHRLIALTFIPNDDPQHLTEVDHINHNRRDNRISNLRWTSKSTNNINRLTINGVQYGFVNELPHDSVLVDHYNNHQFEDVYFSLDNDMFYKKMADHHFRMMHQSVAPSGNQFVQTQSMLRKRVSIYNHVVARDIDLYAPVDDEGNIITTTAPPIDDNNVDDEMPTIVDDEDDLNVYDDEALA